jgi:cell wall-associated NlpC family hydrolase
MQNGWNPFAKKCITQMPYKIESPLTDILQKGDVILYRAKGNQLLGGLECDVTDSPYSHCEIYTGDGWSIEAGAYGVTFGNGFHDYTGVDILRWKKGLSDEQRTQLVGMAYRQLAKPYEYIELFAFPYLSRKAAIKRAANKAFICSELVAWCYTEIGLNPNDNKNPTSIQAPADFGFSDNFNWLGCYSQGQKVEGVKRNQWSDAVSGKPNWFSKFLVWMLVEPFSKREDYYEQLKKSQKIMSKSWKSGSHSLINKK